MAKPTTIRLSEPLQIDGRAVTELRVRRPKVRDLKALETHKDGASDMDQGIAMVALLTDLPAAAIEDMDAGDFATLSEVIAGFFAEAPGTESWRAVVADVAHMLSTPLGDLLEMEWGDVVKWHDEARRIARVKI